MTLPLPIKSTGFGAISDKEVFISQNDSEIILKNQEIIYICQFLKGFIEKNQIKISEHDPDPEKCFWGKY